MMKEVIVPIMHPFVCLEINTGLQEDYNVVLTSQGLATPKSLSFSQHIGSLLTFIQHLRNASLPYIVRSEFPTHSLCNLLLACFPPYLQDKEEIDQTKPKGWGTNRRRFFTFKKSPFWKEGGM